jgi:hypothetical protein
MEQSIAKWLELRTKNRIITNPNESTYWHIQQIIYDFKEAKRIENKLFNKFNSFLQFLEAEKKLGISDVETIERIEFYFNAYYIDLTPHETFKSE